MHYGLIAFLAAVLGADGPPVDRKDDSSKLQGTWHVTRARRDGEVAMDLANAALIVSGDQFTSKSGMKVVARGTWKIDPAKTPRSIDIEYTEGPDKGQTVRGIYALHEGVWILILSPPGQERPVSFKAEFKVGYTSLVLKAAKP